MQENYFQFKLHTKYSLTQSGKYIFQNKHNDCENNTLLKFLVFHYIADYKLDDLELFFRLAGFSAFTREELPSSIIKPVSIDLYDKDYFYPPRLYGNGDEEEAKAYIEKELGEGIIAKYRTVKKKQLLQKKAQLEVQMLSIEEELRNYPEPEEAVQHTFK